MTTATPQTSDELEELFHDGARLKTALEDGSFPGLVKNYVAKFTSANEETSRPVPRAAAAGHAGLPPGAGSAGLPARRGVPAGRGRRPDGPGRAQGARDRELGAR